MVPVVSWFVLRGKCRSCGAKISLQYPLVEGTAGAAFALIGGAALPPFLFPFGAQVWACAIIALLIMIAAYDIRHTIIPDVWVWPFVGLAFLWMFFMTTLLPSSMPLWPLIVSGPISALPLFALWAASRGAWMGFGDVNLALGIGWLLAFPFGLAAIFLAFVLGALVSVPLLVWGKSLSGGGAGFTMKSEVPFGPFLIASTFIVWFALMYNFPMPISFV